ncbi:MAG: hypothetical protein OEL56_02120 [Nitrosopumilus sp.]|nr:hypothetical protein [Nitrosopumilus sp.]MDH3489223.1 hypothetical protein [Nitrosopumilus sp.]MDH3516222.1 hypothetical protein [Nitrosopumilus sp.]MDH3563987.1 hypothetical protein [Nitrosopumilus sp.]MDH5416778.1 hypothetical protein [Nitrosopumilus sp.]
MSSHIDFISVIGFDIVRSADPRIPGEILKERKKAFRNCLHDSKTYQTLLHYANEIGTGDGEFFIVDTKDSTKLLDIVKEVQKNLEKYNESVKNSDWHVMIRTGINVGPAEVKREGGKIIYTSGNAIDYTKRIMDIGQESHILLTSSAVTTILAIDHTYHDKIQYIGEYPSKHGEKFNVHNYFDKEIGNPKNPPKHDLSLDGISDEFRKKIEKEIKEKYESKINENKEENTKFIKKLKFTYLGIIVAIVAVSIISLAILYSSNMNSELYLDDIYDNQYNTVKVSITNKIQSFIDASHILENIVTMGYIENENKTLFIDKKVGELQNSDLFAINKKPIQNSLYFYMLSPSPECKFLLYPFKIDMSRTNAVGLESCDLVNQDLFITNNYPSTGSGTFVNTVSQKIRLTNGEGYDLTTGIAIDWDSISEDIRRTSIKSSDVKFVLVDREQFLIMECTFDKCKSMKSYAVENSPITKNSTYVKYDPINYGDYVLYKDEVFQDKEFHMYDTLRNRILDGWRLIMYVIPSDP